MEKLTARQDSAPYNTVLQNLILVLLTRRRVGHVENLPRVLVGPLDPRQPLGDNFLLPQAGLVHSYRHNKCALSSAISSGQRRYRS